MKYWNINGLILLFRQTAVSNKVKPQRRIEVLYEIVKILETNPKDLSKDEKNTLNFQKNSYSKMKYKFLTYLLFILSISVLESCQKNEEEFSVEDKATFYAEINNVQIILIESDIITDTAIFSMPSRQMSYDERDYTIDIWSLSLGKNMKSDGSITSRLSVDFVNHFENTQYVTDYNISRELFEKVLSEGKKEYTSNNKDFPGISIKWIDADGNLWASGSPYSHEDSSADLTGDKENYFIINYSKNQDTHAGIGIYSQYLDISFQCRLYNWKGESIVMKNAQLKYIYSIF